MGIFDDLKKLGKDLGNEIERNVGADTLRNIKEAVAGATSAVGGSKELPEEYSQFPKFREEIKKFTTKETDKYKRCTMNYSNVSEEEIAEYTSKLNMLGYAKGSDVRFDKGNTYIIVDYNFGDLNLVFHIKR